MKQMIALIATLLVLPFTGSAQVIQSNVTGVVGNADVETSVYVELDTDSSAEPMPVTDSTQVRSESDLAVFEEHMKIENEQVAEVSSGENIALEYYHQGHLFGFFPLLVKSTTVVREDAEGDITVKTTMPWWNIFVTGTDDIATVVDGELEETLSVSVDASARARAHALEAIADAHTRAEVTLSERR